MRLKMIVILIDNDGPVRFSKNDFLGNENLRSFLLDHLMLFKTLKYIKIYLFFYNKQTRF